jgi:hypothetical protein
MLRMIIEGRMTVTLIRKITSPTIRTSIPHWSNGVAAQHSLDLKVRKSHTLEFFTKFAEVLWLAGGGQLMPRSALSPSLFPSLSCWLVNQEIIDLLSTLDSRNKPTRHDLPKFHLTDFDISAGLLQPLLH